MDSKGVARGSLARSLTPEAFFRGYLREREDEDVKDGERNVLYVRVSEREREREWRRLAWVANAPVSRTAKRFSFGYSLSLLFFFFLFER